MCRKIRKERQLTEFENPQNIVENSSYGPVPFRLWCRYESERFKRSGLKPVIRENRGRRIALFCSS